MKFSDFMSVVRVTGLKAHSQWLIAKSSASPTIVVDYRVVTYFDLLLDTRTEYRNDIQKAEEFCEIHFANAVARGYLRIYETLSKSIGFTLISASIELDPGNTLNFHVQQSLVDMQPAEQAALEKIKEQKGLSPTTSGIHPVYKEAYTRPIKIDWAKAVQESGAVTLPGPRLGICYLCAAAEGPYRDSISICDRCFTKAKESDV